MLITYSATKLCIYDPLTLLPLRVEGSEEEDGKETNAVKYIARSEPYFALLKVVDTVGCSEGSASSCAAFGVGNCLVILRRNQKYDKECTCVLCLL